MHPYRPPTCGQDKMYKKDACKLVGVFVEMTYQRFTQWFCQAKPHLYSSKSNAYFMRVFVCGEAVVPNTVPEGAFSLIGHLIR